MLTLIKQQAKKHLARTGYSLTKLSELTRLADIYGSDKGTRSSAHSYTRVYESLFRNMRNRKISILEIGLYRSDADMRRMQCAAEGASSYSALKAPSLEMWRRYFPNAKLFGFDIDDFSNVRIDRCQIIQGDMSSRDDLTRVVNAAGDKLDIIIEDASHASHHQQIALGFLFPHVKPGGLYIIEDLHWQDERLERPEAPKTRELLRRLQVTGVFESPYLSKGEQTYIQDNVEYTLLFDSLSSDVVDGSDAIAVLRKR